MNFILEQYVWEAIRDGRFAFAYGPHPLIALLLLALMPVMVWWLYRRTTRPVSRNWKALLITLRSAVLILLLLILMRPIVTTWQVNPQETYLAVLVDSSESMQIEDLPDGQSRMHAVNDALYGRDGAGGVLDALNERYQVRTFAFGRRLQRVSGQDDLGAGDNVSDISAALQGVTEQLGGLPLSAVVVISDGADNTQADPLITARAMGQQQVPVFTVGVGQQTIPSDVSIVDVSAVSTILDSSVFDVQVSITQQGYAGEPVTLRVMEGDREVAARTVQLGPDGSLRRFELELSPERREPIRYELQIDELDGELITRNNRFQFLVDNSERPPLNVLYVEGHPRNEFKFIRRAVDKDDSLRLASYLQTGPGRVYRQGILSPLELNDGFPDRVEDLYQYEAVVLGDIGRDFFDEGQLSLLQDFVAERGGGLLMSGMIDETFAETVLADILPVTLVRNNTLPAFLQGGTRRGDHPTGELFSPRITAAGEFSPLLRLASDDNENRRLWQALPELQGVHITGRPKPGATVLLEHPVLQYQNQAVPVMTTQRYGSGRTMAIGTASTWRWQMLTHSTDESHAHIWRQLLRWMAQGALERISVDFDSVFYNEGDTVEVRATVLDEKYQPDNSALLWLQRVSPTGDVVDMPMDWDINEDGVYRGRFTVEDEGVYQVTVDVASAAGTGIETERQAAFVVTPSLREFNDAGQDAGLMTRIADNSGGRYYPLSEISQLVNDTQHTPSAYSREVQHDLWDRPFWLLALIGLMCADWALRRRKGLS